MSNSRLPPRTLFFGILTLAVLIIVIYALSIMGQSNNVTTTQQATGGAAPTRTNLLKNGGFETGDLTGWDSTVFSGTVESTLVKDGTYATSFQTPSNGPALITCTNSGDPSACASLNDSTISQNIPIISVSSATRFQIALYPSFAYPSFFQVVLQFHLASNHPYPSSITLYYLIFASSQQCTTYQRLVENAETYGGGGVFCLSANQGQWNTFTRNVWNDVQTISLPQPQFTPVSLSDLSASNLTVGLSFSGGSTTERVYADSAFFG